MKRHSCDAVREARGVSRRGSVSSVEVLARESEGAPPSEARRAARGPTRAQLSGITAEGVVLVTLDGHQAVAAELATGVSDETLLRAIERRGQVLIDFIDGAPNQPVIVGLLRERLDVSSDASHRVTEPNVELTAGESLRLRCGESAIELQKDGRVTIRGSELRSVATGGNLVQGAHVDIN